MNEDAKIIQFNKGALKKKAQNAGSDFVTKAKSMAQNGSKKVVGQADERTKRVREGVLGRMIRATKKQLNFFENLKKK